MFGFNGSRKVRNKYLLKGEREKVYTTSALPHLGYHARFIAKEDLLLKKGVKEVEKP